MRSLWWISDCGVWPLSKHLTLTPPCSEVGCDEKTWNDHVPCRWTILTFVLWWFGLIWWCGACRQSFERVRNSSQSTPRSKGLLKVNLGFGVKLCGVDKDDQLFWLVCTIGRAGTFGHVNHLWTWTELFVGFGSELCTADLKAKPLALLLDSKNAAIALQLRLRPVAAESWDGAGASRGAVHGLAPQRHKSLQRSWNHF